MRIKRTSYLSDRTLGVATLPNGVMHWTLEREDNNNKVGVSCIPEGNYKFKVDTQGRFQYYRVLDVPNRTNIEFHLGTKPSHSEGCILMSAKGLGGMKEFYYDIDLEYVLEIR